MNKKTILITICVVLVGVSAILLFRTFFSTPTPIEISASAADSAGSGPGGQTILPYGRALDFAPVDQYNVNRKRFPYPVVSPGEIGVDSLQLTK